MYWPLPLAVMYPAWEVDEAVAYAGELGVRHLLLDIDAMDNPGLRTTLPKDAITARGRCLSNC